ncbi:hypothetical protein AA0113_g2107 [Alternaria arborescens]|uniref:Uncharacterized protein n=1 Tax=Alternaria arborescens TaxID=156630 RepID=A0A4V1X7U8_9PLEO|nr:hypothetical protein AA0111_g118 [Alternaria arborescens]RYN32888.1 hypothetical protein AA0112_g5807 [Alternaria arborescens]RYO43508.1 hypothetical protein AA0111_g118 [Alternaria arborescens]RYO71238.1 hypothetical protein AA0113_g2107 [Alternaria arborescens]
MTHRSSKTHQPKTTTISRRLRDRADQNLSVQPPEIPQIRGARSHRAADLPTPRHNSIDYQTPGSHPLPLAWNTSHVLEDIPPNYTFHLLESDHDPSPNPSFAQALDFSHHESLQGSNSELESSVNLRAAHISHDQPTRAPALVSSPVSSISGSNDLELQLSADLEQPNRSSLELQDMSTLGFMMPSSQYGMGHYGSPQTSYSSGYPPLQSYAEPRSSNSNPYSSSYASSPVHNESQQRRPDQHPILPPYQPQHPSLPRSPYQQQQSTDLLRGHASPMAPSAHSYTYSAPHNSVPAQSLGSNTYSSSQPYPATTYGSNEYHPLPTMYPPTTTTPAVYPSYESSQSAPPPSGSVPALSSSPSTQVLGARVQWTAVLYIQ